MKTESVLKDFLGGLKKAKKPRRVSKAEKAAYKPRSVRWFAARIGKTIYRDDQGCDCEVCTGINKRGLKVIDATHANYLHDVDHEMAGEGVLSYYRDTLERKARS